MSREVEEMELQAQWRFDPSSRNWSWMDRPFHGPIAAGSSQGNYSSAVASLVRLPAGKGSSLNWDEEVSGLPSGLILWYLDLAILPMSAPVTEEGSFQALKFAVELFSRHVWTLHRERSLGVILSHVNLDLKGFCWDLEQIEQFAAWLSDRQDSSPDVGFADSRVEELSQVKRLLEQGDLEGFLLWSSTALVAKQYILQILSQYWHYLGSGLSEDCPALVGFENSRFSLAEQIQLLAQPIWEHLSLIGEGIHPSLITLQRHRSQRDTIWPSVVETPPLIGLVVPSPGKLTPQGAQKMANLMERLDKARVNYRLIFETELTQHWSGLDDLLVFNACVTPSGLRMLRGFHASMGNIFPLDPCVCSEHPSGGQPAHEIWFETLKRQNPPRPWIDLLQGA